MDPEAGEVDRQGGHGAAESFHRTEGDVCDRGGLHGDGAGAADDGIHPVQHGPAGPRALGLWDLPHHE